MHAIVALTLSLAVTAPTADQEEEARKLFDAGGAAYAHARYADAARALGAAYRLLPRPAIAFSWAQALRRQYFVDRDRRTLDRAIALFERYLEEVPEGHRREDAINQLQSLVPLRARLVERRPTAPPPPEPEPTPTPEPEPERTELMIYTAVATASVSIDGARAPGSGAIVEVAPGPHAVKVEAPGYYDETRSAVAHAGRLIPIEVPLRAKPALVSVDGPEGAEVFLDGERVRALPLEAPLEVAAGAHRLAVQQDGSIPFRTELRVSRDGRARIVAELPSTAQRRAAVATLGAAAALGAAALVTGALALHFEVRAAGIDDLRGEENIDSETLEGEQSDLARRDALRTAAIATLTGAAAAGGIGLLLYLFDTPAPPVGLLPLEDGALLTFGGRFSP